MARFKFRMPDIGEGVAEGEIVEWHVKPGQAVDEDQPLVDIMTDKATVNIGAPRGGRIAEVKVDRGGVAKVGDVLVVIEVETSGDDEVTASAVGDIRSGLPGSSYFADAKNASTPVVAKGAKALATPAVRRLARELGLDINAVTATGEGGRVTKEDLQRNRSTTVDALVHSTESEQRVPFVGVRRAIAKRMQQAKNTAAHFTFVEECDVTRLVELRERMRPAAVDEGVQLNYLPFIVRATVLALKAHPMLNSSLDEACQELVLKRYYHIGIATATEQGVVVPVLRHADQLSLIAMAREIARMAQGARTGGLSSQELSGSTFTVTSLGKQGGLLATPVLNYPEVGILAVHRIKEKPVVRAGEIAVGKIALLSLSLDHRIIDGHMGAEFAYTLIQYLENPERLLLHG